MRTILIISGVVSLGAILLVTARDKDPISVPPKPDHSTFQRSKPVADSSTHPSADFEGALGKKTQRRSTARPHGGDRPAELGESPSQAALTTALLEQVRALRAEVADLRRSRIGAGPGSQQKTADVQPVGDPATETDHNPNIPGIQQADEPFGRSVDGDPQNTIHPDTPKDIIAEDEALKRASQVLTRAAEAE